MMESRSECGDYEYDLYDPDSTVERLRQDNDQFTCSVKLCGMVVNFLLLVTIAICGTILSRWDCPEVIPTSDDCNPDAFANRHFYFFMWYISVGCWPFCWLPWLQAEQFSTSLKRFRNAFACLALFCLGAILLLANILLPCLLTVSCPSDWESSKFYNPIEFDRRQTQLSLFYLAIVSLFLSLIPSILMHSLLYHTLLTLPGAASREARSPSRNFASPAGGSNGGSLGLMESRMFPHTSQHGHHMTPKDLDRFDRSRTRNSLSWDDYYGPDS